MFRLLTLILGLTLVAACTPVSDTDPLVDLGDFSLGHNVVVAGKAQQGPISRDATPEEWVAVLTEAVDRRLGQYQGEKLYHVAVSVEGFMLAPAGVPLLFKPKSALIVNVTVWDDAAGVKLNDKVEQFTIFETTTGESAIVGSGHDRTREEQMQMLARNAVHEIEEWLVAQRSAQGWFGGAPDLSANGEETPPEAKDLVAAGAVEAPAPVTDAATPSAAPTRKTVTPRAKPAVNG